MATVQQGVDSFSPLSSTVVNCLKSGGYSFVCRYYCASNTNPKLLKKDEAITISNGGLDIVTVYQDYNNSVSYFDYNQGYNQCNNAIGKAELVGQPYNTTIYFSVDFNATTSDLPAIKEYFRGVSAAMSNYRQLNGGGWDIGVYGSYFVVSNIYGIYGVYRTWQTYAWSNGQIYLNYNIYQYQNDVTICSSAFDKDQSNSNGNTIGGFRITA